MLVLDVVKVFSLKAFQHTFIERCIGVSQQEKCKGCFMESTYTDYFIKSQLILNFPFTYEIFLWIPVKFSIKCIIPV